MLRKDSGFMLGIYWVPLTSLAMYVKLSNIWNQAYTVELILLNIGIDRKKQIYR